METDPRTASANRLHSASAARTCAPSSTRSHVEAASVRHVRVRLHRSFLVEGPLGSSSTGAPETSCIAALRRKSSREGVHNGEDVATIAPEVPHDIP
jgi:hypothetical protein